jgi:hypothetical protein
MRGNNGSRKAAKNAKWNKSDIGGIVVPLVTPLHEDGRTICEAGVHQLVERLVTQKVHGVFGMNEIVYNKDTEDSSKADLWQTA